MDAKGQWVNSVVKEFEGRLLRYTCRFVDAASAKEIVQETFLRLWEQDRGKLEGYLAQWLFTVCRNQALDRCRAEGKQESFDGNWTDPNPGPDERVESSRQKAGLNILVSKLPSHQQEVLRLKFEEGLSYKEISAITGHTVSYVGVLIHEAIAKLRKNYE